LVARPRRYEPFNFNRTELHGGAFGGKEDDNDVVTRRPIVFIHGASDQAIGYTDNDNGFRHSIEYFLHRGYKKSELYTSTWGLADLNRQF
jgi:triacylglycerol lipase